MATIANKRYMQWVWSLLLLLLQQHVAAAQAPSMYFVGRAFDLDNDELVYTEEHEYQPSGLYTVIYREPDGQQFATKTADFSAASFAPSLDQHNDRNGETIRITRKDDGTLIATYRAARDKRADSADMAATATTVIDAGFHPYIIAHWDVLVGGATRHIDYVVPSWLRLITLTIKAINCTDSQGQCFSITPSNVLFAMLVTPIELTYDVPSRQLIEFRGTSNIVQRNGDYHRVRIVYEYSPAISRVANANNGRAD